MEIQARVGSTVMMMTNGPAATVGGILPIDLPRPRHRLALADDPHDDPLHAEILRLFHQRQGHPGAAAA